MTNIVVSAFLAALVATEGNNPAPGGAGELGWFQITPVFVKEVNRLGRANRWTLEHRKDYNASRAMVWEWLLLSGYKDPETAAHAYNAGPDLKPESREYRERFMRNYQKEMSK